MLRELPEWNLPPKERRRLHRFCVDSPALLLSTALGKVNANLVDLSQFGCRIRTRARCYRGEHFVLTIDSLCPHAVKVAWSHDGEVGLSFIEGLSWAVVTALVARSR